MKSWRNNSDKREMIQKNAKHFFPQFNFQNSIFKIVDDFYDFYLNFWPLTAYYGKAILRYYNEYISPTFIKIIIDRIYNLNYIFFFVKFVEFFIIDGISQRNNDFLLQINNFIENHDSYIIIIYIYET